MSTSAQTTASAQRPSGRPTLLVLLKHPTPGRVKTRLAAAIGAEAAAAHCRQWISHVFDRVQPLRSTTSVVALFDGASLEGFAPWHSAADEWVAQADGSLGDRLARGFEHAFAGGGPVAAIGVDCLDIDADLLRSAFSALATSDAVFGPTLDGGYYLVGAARPLEGFFDDVPWSTSETMRAHVDRCRSRGWTVSLLPPRRDIDTWEDLAAHLSGQEQ